MIQNQIYQKQNIQNNMIKFDYKLDYKNINFKPNDKRYRIGRGE